VSADFVAQLLGLLIYHQRRRQIPFSRSKDQPLSALKAVAFYNLQFRCFFHAFSDHPDGAPLMLATCKCGYSLDYKPSSILICWPLLQEQEGLEVGPLVLMQYALKDRIYAVVKIMPVNCCTICKQKGGDARIYKNHF